MSRRSNKTQYWNNKMRCNNVMSWGFSITVAQVPAAIIIPEIFWAQLVKMPDRFRNGITNTSAVNDRVSYRGLLSHAAFFSEVYPQYVQYKNSFSLIGLNTVLLCSMTLLSVWLVGENGSFVLLAESVPSFMTIFSFWLYAIVKSDWCFIEVL